VTTIHRQRPETRRGFTLVELMVAITGGLFVSVVVFALARDGARFYQREARAADATMAAIVGFERLRADISRAGFLATPNVRWDPRVCPAGGPVGNPGWPQALQRLAAVRVLQNESPGSAVISANGLSPDAIVLAGSYAASEQFPVWNIQNDGASFVVFLQWQTGPLGRLGYASSPNQETLLQSLFPPGRALRIQDQAGEIQFATITSVSAQTTPQIVLAPQPPLTFRQTAGATCGLKGNVTGALVNVVNFVRYDLRNLATGSHFGTNPSYTALYGGENPNDASRTELVRVELDTNGAPIAGTEELVAEQAVDLKLGITVANTILNGTDPALQTFVPGHNQIPSWAGDLMTTAAAQNQGPHRVRAVRVRLSVRSQEADRDAPILPGPTVAPGLYRIGLGPAGDAPYARVRTIQTDLALHNQMGVSW
jgi:type II secretory pathway pseudopilin PulG